MAYSVYLLFEDGKRSFTDEFANLGHATEFALNTADNLDGRMANPDQARAVAIYSGNHLEISIKLIPGGLLGNRGDPKLRSI